MLIALVPAHNEQDNICAAITALQTQTEPPQRIVIVADNCTDGTVALAGEMGAEVFETVGNQHKKVGGLNRALAALLPELSDDDSILVTDADCTLDPPFLAVAMRYIRRGYGGVGGTFRGASGGGFVGHLQRNEYARYARDVERRNGKCLVLTGTATVFRVSTLRHVSQARLSGKLPAGDGQGGIYDTGALTEDNELSFAIMHLGQRIIAPPRCTLVTEVMESWRDLWRQRLRWKRGAVENCFQYGFTRITWRYWGRQLFTFLGILVTIVYLSTIGRALAATGTLHMQPIWLAISALFIVERAVTVKKRGWKFMLPALLMYELCLDYFLQACNGKAYFDALLHRNKDW